MNKEERSGTGNGSSSGLSNRPYSADFISPYHEKALKAVKKAKQKNRKLTALERYYVENEQKYRRQSVAQAFEERNGFPYSWYEYELQKIIYQERGIPEYYIKIHPFMVLIGIRGLHSIRKKRIEKRNVIQTYSLKSRCKLHSRLLMVRWDNVEKDRIRIGTLTYPGRYPTDGKIIKRHLRNILKRLMRFAKNYGGIAVVCKLEFQTRGAPHFHLLTVSQEKIGLETFRTWLAASWAEVVNEWTVLESGLSSEEKKLQYANHLKAGTELSEIKSTLGSMNYFSFYIGKGKKAKEQQHMIPAEYKNVGRWWGLSGDVESLIPAVTEARTISKDFFDKAWDMIESRLFAHGVKPNPYALGKRLFVQSVEETEKFISELFAGSEHPQVPEGKISGQ
jgi:hypothetical protein